jgi:hypothetical protein
MRISKQAKIRYIFNCVLLIVIVLFDVYFVYLLTINKCNPRLILFFICANLFLLDTPYIKYYRKRRDLFSYEEGVNYKFDLLQPAPTWMWLFLIFIVSPSVSFSFYFLVHNTPIGIFLFIALLCGIFYIFKIFKWGVQKKGIIVSYDDNSIIIDNRVVSFELIEGYYFYRTFLTLKLKTNELLIIGTPTFGERSYQFEEFRLGLIQCFQKYKNHIRALSYFELRFKK